VIAFSEFGFPKSHAARSDCSRISLPGSGTTTPSSTNVALFNNQPIGLLLDRRPWAVTPCATGFEMRLPDINVSDVWCTVESQAVRIGLGFIRHWSEETATATVVEREQHGPFKSVGDSSGARRRSSNAPPSKPSCGLAAATDSA